MPKILRNWFSPDWTYYDPRDGDPYLESLVRQLVDLGGGKTAGELHRATRAEAEA